MGSVPSALAFLLTIFAGWGNRHQLKGVTVTLAARLARTDKASAAGHA